MSLAALLLIAQGSGSALALLNDRQFCDAFSRNASGYVGQGIGAATITSATANCGAKLLQLGVRLAVTDQDREFYMRTFVNSARAGVCTLEEPMATFNRRGWKLEYTFIFPDDARVVQTLEC